MQTSAIWVSTGSDATGFYGIPTTYTRTVNIPAGNYTVEFSVDDTGSVSIDGAILSASSTANFGDPPTSCPVTITNSGSHTITLEDTNAFLPFNQNNVWSINPGGVSMALIGNGGQTILDSSTAQPIDTSVPGLWTANVACPAAQYFDCTSLSCKSCS
jgi:hypothetical protein